MSLRSKQQQKLPRREMMDSVPRLNPAVRWEELDSGVLSAAYRKDMPGWRKVFARIAVAPEVGHIALDKTGSQVVRAIDGQRTIRDLIALVSDRFKLSRKEAEVSTLKYMEALGRRGLVGFEIRPAEKEE
jgi:hypothetical protein